MTAPKPAAPATAPKAESKPRKERKAAAIPENESSEARFKRICAPRISKAVTALKRIETVGRSPAYDFTPEQAGRVMKYLDEAVEAVRMAFVNRVNKRTAPSITL